MLRYKVIDLFSGAGGMSLGFQRAGFDVLLAVEKEPDFARTYEANFGPHVIVGDIAELMNGRLSDLRADVVIGGPPCQGFSNLTGNKAGDPRRAMWQHFMGVVAMSECHAFVIENVPNIISSPEGNAIIDCGKRLGFHMSHSTLLASHFGVAQNRRRAFIVGSRHGLVRLRNGNGLFKTVREAFDGIPHVPNGTEFGTPPVCGRGLHVGRNPTQLSLARYAHVPEGGNRFDLQRAAPELTPRCWKEKRSGGTDIFGRLSWDEPARCTIRCEFYKPEKGRYLHPSQDRPITHWEAARLQSFPDDFLWHGSKSRVAVQIGNAVPPALAQAVAEDVMCHLVEVQESPITGRCTTEEVENGSPGGRRLLGQGSRA